MLNRYEKRFGPYFTEPVVAGLDSEHKPQHPWNLTPWARAFPAHMLSNVQSPAMSMHHVFPELTNWRRVFPFQRFSKVPVYIWLHWVSFHRRGASRDGHVAVILIHGQEDLHLFSGSHLFLEFFFSAFLDVFGFLSWEGEGRKEGRKGGRKEGRKEGRKDSKEGRKEMSKLYTSLYIFICLSINLETYADVFACSLACENRYCHSALGGGAAHYPNPPSRLSFFKTQWHTCLSLYIYKHFYTYIYI